MKCYNCDKEIMQEVTFKEYKAKFAGRVITVKNAKILKCEKCGSEAYRAKEIKRWEKLYNKNKDNK